MTAQIIMALLKRVNTIIRASKVKLAIVLTTAREILSLIEARIITTRGQA